MNETLKSKTDGTCVIAILQLIIFWLWYWDIEPICNQPWYVLWCPTIAELTFTVIIGITFFLIIIIAGLISLVSKK